MSHDDENDDEIDAEIEARLRSDASAWRNRRRATADEDRLLDAATGPRPVRAGHRRRARVMLPVLAAAVVVILAGIVAVVRATDVAGPGPKNDERNGPPTVSPTYACPSSPSANSLPGGPVPSSTSRPVAHVAVAAALAAVTVTSCSTDPAPTHSTTTSPRPAQRSTSKSTSNSTSQPGSSPASSTSPTHARSSATRRAKPPFVAGAECRTAQLRLTLKPGFNGAGGTAYMTLTLTNTSTVRCVTKGYPGLSIVDSAGRTVQHAAERHTGTRTQPVEQVSLAPGQIGYVLWTSSDVVPGPHCPTDFHGTRLRLFPPDNTVALYAPYTQGFCDLGVGPVTDKKNA